MKYIYKYRYWTVYNLISILEGLDLKTTTNLQVMGADGSRFFYVPMGWVQVFGYKKGQQFKYTIHRNGDITFSPVKKK